MNFLTKRDVAARLRCHPNHIPRMVREGQFPQPVRLSSLAVLWPEEEVDAWMRAQIEVRDRELALDHAKRGGAPDTRLDAR